MTQLLTVSGSPSATSRGNTLTRLVGTQLTGYPHLEEVYWFGEGVLPILEERGPWKHPDRTGAALGDHVPFAAAL